MTEPTDDLDDLLAPQPAPAPANRREAVLRRTLSSVTRHRWMRRAAQGGVVLAVFLAGGLTGRITRAERERVIEIPGPTERMVVPVLVPMAAPETTPSPISPREAASAAELRAEQEDDPARAADHYRQAGDAFLSYHDFANATRCYRLYLRRAGDGALGLEANDSWLLVSLKNAAYREKVHAAKNDG